MNRSWIKWLCTWGIAVVAVAVGLSLVLGVPYAYTALGFSGLVVVGHIVTIDDDEPGGFGNPDSSKAVWRGSLKELGIKLLILVALCVAVAAFPVLHGLGAR